MACYNNRYFVNQGNILKMDCQVGITNPDIVGEDKYYESVLLEYGLRQVRHSCIADSSTEEIFRSFLRDKKIKNAIEIGTLYGTGTALLAHYADKVVTVDIHGYREPTILWVNMGVNKKIEYYIISPNDDIKSKRKILRKIGDFDFAFIDGCHREGILVDWKLLKKCGRVLFHDYFRNIDGIPGLREEWGAKPSPQILDLVDSLPKNEVTIKEPFAYWEKNGHY